MGRGRRAAEAARPVSGGKRSGRSHPPPRESGAVRKEWGGRLRVALVYPNRYAAGMANLGFLTVHARINARPGALCERAFLPEGGAGSPAVTLESGRPLSDFDLVAFSLSVESDLANLPSILSAGGLQPFRESRAASGSGAPLVLGGGFAASLNPEPAGTVADAVVVGDGERALEAVLDLGAPSGGADEERLRALAEIPGVYVPAGYRLALRADGLLEGIAPRPGFPERVRREAVDLRDWPQPPVVRSFDAELGDLALVETSRGCPGRCAFCAASHACPAFRSASVGQVRAAADAALPERPKVGLVGAAVLDWPPFRAYARELVAQGRGVSPASVRADRVDAEIAELLFASGHRTVALAPECASPPLRARVGKALPDEAFHEAGRTLARAGIVSFKLYFLVGVPGAGREEEVDGTASFVRAFREAVLEEGKRLGRMGTVTATLSPFVPKPFTPLQWAPMAGRDELEARLSGIARALRPVPNVRVAADPARAALFQGYLGLSDRRVEDTLRKCLPGKASLPSGPLPVPLETLLHREKGAGEAFPWDVVEGGLPKGMLRERYERFAGG